MASVTKQHVERLPGKCGGKPCIKGTRVRVWDVYVLHETLGKSADEIVGAFPELSLADVHAALAYYFDHKDVIDSEMRSDDAAIEHLKSLKYFDPSAEIIAGDKMDRVQ